MSLYTPEPLTAQHYQALVDLKYKPDALGIQGWVLRDSERNVRNWHLYEDRGGWASCAEVLSSFVPDAKLRHNLTIMGWTVEQTLGIDELTTLLHAARGDDPEQSAVEP